METALQSSILLDIFPIFAESSRSNGAQFSAGQGRLEHVGSIHGPFRSARTHKGVKLVDEKNDLAFGLSDFFENRFQPVFEFAAELCPRHKRGEIQSDDAFCFQDVRNVTGDNSLRQAFDDGGFADARFADQHRIILRAPRKNLHDAANLFIAADDRIELLFPRQFRQVTRILLQSIIRGFRILRRYALRAPHSGKSLQNGFVGSSLPL